MREPSWNGPHGKIEGERDAEDSQTGVQGNSEGAYKEGRKWVGEARKLVRGRSCDG